MKTANFDAIFHLPAVMLTNFVEYTVEIDGMRAQRSENTI